MSVMKRKSSEVRKGFVLLICTKSVFTVAALFTRIAVKTRIRRFDWSAKMFAANNLNGFLLFSLFAQIKSPNGKRA